MVAELSFLALKKSFPLVCGDKKNVAVSRGLDLYI